MVDRNRKDALETEWQSDTLPNPGSFLGACEVIDVDSWPIVEQARKLRAKEPTATAKRCFEFVRDEIRHSSDYGLSPVTCRASSVLEHKTGYCYAKSHLLCALLRANAIPAGLCYQRLSVDGMDAPFCLHGLNAVYLPDHGWYRLDARGNREGIDAQFCPPGEQLAFDLRVPGERNLPGIYRVPLAEVTECLSRYKTWQAVRDHLPDVVE